MSMITELIGRLRQHADTFEKSGFAVDGLIKDYREAADTIQLLSEKLHASQTETCKDCISRHVIKEQMIKYGFHAPDMTVTEFVEDLPTVHPEQKVIRCNDCKHLYQDGECPLRLWKYHVENDFCSYGEKM